MKAFEYKGNKFTPFHLDNTVKTFRFASSLALPVIIHWLDFHNKDLNRIVKIPYYCHAEHCCLCDMGYQEHMTTQQTHVVIVKQYDDCLLPMEGYGFMKIGNAYVNELKPIGAKDTFDAQDALDLHEHIVIAGTSPRLGSVNFKYFDIQAGQEFEKVDRNWIDAAFAANESNIIKTAGQAVELYEKQQQSLVGMDS